MNFYKKCIFLQFVFIVVFNFSACKNNVQLNENFVNSNEVSCIEDINNDKLYEDIGYGLTVDNNEKYEAENDCKIVMDYTSEIYQNADKGSSLNIVLNNETILDMYNKIKELGFPVYTIIPYSKMENYEAVDIFLEEAKKGKDGAVTVYEIYSDGSIGRMKYTFDGSDMYVISTRGVWKENGEKGIYDISKTKIKNWKYTEKGWFCYELCVPEPPEVTEIVDGSCTIRIKPMTEENKALSEKCVLGLGYQGNNVLCSNWDINNLDKLDYNGIYEYLYWMKYNKLFDGDNINGIESSEFENLIMEYFPVTREELRKYAVYDEETSTYAWERLGCFNYSPTFFSTSLPEVTYVENNEDGTTTLTVDAVCDMVLCDDAVITHRLTVRFNEDGSFQYLGNEILNDGIKNIPGYEFRIKKQ